MIDPLRDSILGLPVLQLRVGFRGRMTVLFGAWISSQDASHPKATAVLWVCGARWRLLRQQSQLVSWRDPDSRIEEAFAAMELRPVRNVTIGDPGGFVIDFETGQLEVRPTGAIEDSWNLFLEDGIVLYPNAEGLIEEEITVDK